MELKHTENYFIKTLLNKAKLKEIMVTKIISVKEDEPFSHVAEKFQSFNIRHLPVIDEKNKLVGMITQKDLYRACPPRKTEDGGWFYDKQILDHYVLKYIMTKDPVALLPEDSVAKALLIMADRKFGCIPIVDEKNTLCGLVTQIDILRIGARILIEGEGK